MVKQQNQAAIIRSVLTALALALLFLFFKISIAQYRFTDGLVLPNGKAVGGDFVTFYSAGKTFLENRHELYDFVSQEESYRLLFSGTSAVTGSLPFVYPPVIAFLFAPFSQLSLLNAYYLWSALSFVLYCTVIFVVLRNLPYSKLDRFIAFLLSASFFPFLMECLAGGQLSVITLLLFAVIYLCLRRGREFAAGIALGLGAFKPPLFVVFSLFMLTEKRFRLLSGAVLASALLVVPSLYLVGVQGFFSYLTQASRYSYGNELLPGKTLNVEKGAGLFVLFWRALPGMQILARVLYIAAAALSFVAYFRAMRRCSSFSLRLAAQISLSLFLSVWVGVYDLTVLALPLLLVFSDMSLLNLRAHALAIVAAFGMSLYFLHPWLIAGELVVNTAALFFALWIGSLYFLMKATTQRAHGDGLL